MYRGLRKVGIEQLTRAVNDNLQAREESKSLAMRALHVFRRVLPALASEAGLDGDEWAYLRIRELLEPRFRARLGELVETRRVECAEALEVEMPDEYNVPLPAAPGRPRAPERPRARRTRPASHRAWPAASSRRSSRLRPASSTTSP